MDYPKSWPDIRARLDLYHIYSGRTVTPAPVSITRRPLWSDICAPTRGTDSSIDHIGAAPWSTGGGGGGGNRGGGAPEARQKDLRPMTDKKRLSCRPRSMPVARKG